jgi:hypothetical protein
MNDDGPNQDILAPLSHQSLRITRHLDLARLLSDAAWNSYTEEPCTLAPPNRPCRSSARAGSQLRILNSGSAGGEANPVVIPLTVGIGPANALFLCRKKHSVDLLTMYAFSDNLSSMSMVLFPPAKGCRMSIRTRYFRHHWSSGAVERWAVAILMLVICGTALSQIRPDSRDRLYPTLLDKGSRITDGQTQKVQALFDTIESAIIAGKIDKFSDHFDKQVFVNITRGESGYFSSDQATSLLQHYLSTRKVVSFRFTRSSEKGFTPYATGRLVTIYNGSQESAQVYVSCSWQKSGWVIGQFNIY